MTDELNLFLQKQFIENINLLGNGNFIEVININNDKNESKHIYSAFVKKNKIKNALSNYDWDIKYHYTKPYLSNTNKLNFYYNNKSGLTPLIFLREYPGIDKFEFDILQEFILYFNLFKNDKGYYRFTDTGDTEQIIKIENHKIEIKKTFIQVFCYIKDCSFFIYFCKSIHSKKTLCSLGINQFENKIFNNDNCYYFYVQDYNFDEYKSMSYIVGKKLIRGFTKKQLNTFYETKYADFHILDTDMNESIASCNEDKCFDGFSKNIGKPYALTPVLFKKDVLQKYYNNPDKYIVGDGFIECKGFWNLRIDNNLEDSVSVFLKDLGYIPYDEQIYWKCYNIVNSKIMSDTSILRNFCGEWADPKQPDLFFKQKYKELNNEWFKKYKYHLFKPLDGKDLYHLNGLHIPLSNNKKEFDDMVLSLTKLMIDSLNEKELNTIIGEKGKQVKGSINKFEIFLEYNHKYSKDLIKDLIKYLRNLQNLRSAGSAHRKGKEYYKICSNLGIKDDNLIISFNNLLIGAIKTLNTIEKIFLHNKHNE